jgi:hypothetical protein
VNNNNFGDYLTSCKCFFREHGLFVFRNKVANGASLCFLRWKTLYHQQQHQQQAEQLSRLFMKRLMGKKVKENKKEK